MFTNLGETGSKGPDSIGSHYKDQDHDRKVKLFNCGLCHALVNTE